MQISMSTKPLFAALGLAWAAAAAQAQDSTAAQANNPLANTTAFNLQNYYIGELTEPDRSANQFWLRYARPFKLGETNWLMRASLPVNSYPVGPSNRRENGLGDLNLFAAYLIDVGNPAVSFGIGPQTTLPTATEDGLGSDKYTLGLVNVLFDASPTFSTHCCFRRILAIRLMQVLDPYGFGSVECL